ncbi:MAG: hypothetical protein ACFFDY_11195 [Candidatus Thorarchaeota archaeon]
MNEQDNTTKNKAVEKSKINISEYLDLSMAVINTIVIILLFALIRNNITILVILGYILLAILVIGTVFTFIRRNPFYIYFCYGLTLCGVTGNLYLLPINGILWIISILQGFYIYRIIEFDILYNLDLVKRSEYYITMRKSKKQVSEEKHRAEVIQKYRKSIERKFKFNSIAVISLLCSIGLFFTLIFSA